MTIKKGEEWGTASARPHDLLVAAGDAELAHLVERDRAGSYGLSSGDLYRSLGAPADREEMQRLPLDALMVSIDGGEPVLAVAHVLARTRSWTGSIIVAANCEYLGSWNVAPRAHPNDGRFDVVEVAASMSLRQRLQARRRVTHGTHVPHPDITARTAVTAAWTFDQPLDVVVDGVPRGRCTRLAVAISADHFAIYI